MIRECGEQKRGGVRGASWHGKERRVLWRTPCSVKARGAAPPNLPKPGITVSDTITQTSSAVSSNMPSPGKRLRLSRTACVQARARDCRWPIAKRNRVECDDGAGGECQNLGRTLVMPPSMGIRSGTALCRRMRRAYSFFSSASLSAAAGSAMRLCISKGSSARL